MSHLRHLLVDGANITHGWPELKKLALRDIHAARSRLVQRLAPLHDFEGIRLTVVFDGRGADLMVEHPSAAASLAVIYTSAALTADDVIEQMVANSADPATCGVATDDRAERETVAALGATLFSARDLSDWLSRVEAQQTTVVRRERDANAKRWKQP